MKAMVLTGFGGAEVLELREWPTPVPGPGQVLIKILACSVNPIDRKIRAGLAKDFVRTKPPMIIGADISGEIAQLGTGTTRLKVADPVYAKLPGDLGGYAEYIALDESIVALRPSNLSALEAAGVPAGATTALQSLRDKGELKAGQRVLINGASGGVGLFAVQLAHELGAHVTAVCSPSGFERVKGFGADEVIDYKTSDFTALGKKWNVIFDVSATRNYGQCSKALESGGVYVTTINTFGDLVAPVLNPFRSRKARFIIVKGSSTDLDYVRGLIESGKLKVVVEKVFPLAAAFEAQQFLETQNPRGKVILDIATLAA